MNLTSLKYLHNYFHQNHINKYLCICLNSYHSKSGVFGYNPALEEKCYFKPSSTIIQAQSENNNLFRYINAFRKYGHLQANINPLFENTNKVPELDFSLYGLEQHDTCHPNHLLHGCSDAMTVGEMECKLKELYCGSMSAEFMHLPTAEERDWFAEAFESINSSKDFLSNEEKIHLASNLLKSQIWDNFLAIKFQSVKRYGAEGAEAMMAYFYETFESLAKDGVEEVMIGIAHRGRLNFQTVLLDFPPVVLFRKMKGLSEFPDNAYTSGDVLSHMSSSVYVNTSSGKKLHVSLLPNPSHLEAINAAVCGKTRARQMSLKDGHYSEEKSIKHGDKVVALQIHGDASLAGQGIIQEMLALSELPHFNTGGSIHMCVNNQIGYTTPSQRARSSLYCTDVAKIGSYPVIHVNGDEPLEVAKAARLAVSYQRKFRRDVFVDFMCWRRWGHNELDNPRFTNPDMYSIIDNRKSVPDTFIDNVIEEGHLSKEDVARIKDEFLSVLNEDFNSYEKYKVEPVYLQKQWSGFIQPSDSVEIWDTGVDVNTLKFLGKQSVTFPETMNIHPQLKKVHVNARLDRLSAGDGINWATAEALAMASLLDQGYNVRLCGQDVGRGTFSQRHCMLVDQSTSDMLIPLNHMREDQKGFLEVANSILSEEAVLGFEYGMSIESPNTLCMWEAQFGDFFNGAQIILDTMVSSGELKWMMQSGLVMILPHGMDGAGPEHSSCHFERFLQNSDSREDRPDSEMVNWNIAYPTTPAQYFHLLRRQMVRNYRKPLLVIGPKTLLRLPEATSTLKDMAPGTFFKPVLGDDSVAADRVKKVIFLTGKLFYTLDSERKARKIDDVALVRVESLCPFPTQDINNELQKYKNAKTFIWAQEEHRNMGGWSFVHPRFRNLCKTQLKYAGRDVSAVPATGIGMQHNKESRDIIDKAFSK